MILESGFFVAKWLLDAHIIQICIDLESLTKEFASLAPGRSPENAPAQPFYPAGLLSPFLR